MSYGRDYENMISQLLDTFKKNWDDALRVIDTDGSRTISHRELYRHLKNFYPEHFAIGVSNEVFKTLDRNQDGQITRAEAQNQVVKSAHNYIKLIFSHFDRNYGRALMSYGGHDQRVTRREFRAILQRLRLPRQVTEDIVARVFSTLDKDGDGTISWDDLRPRVPFYYVQYHR